MQDSRNKYHPQSHISDILWHFIGPCNFEKYKYESALLRLEQYISVDSTSITLGPYTKDNPHYIRKMEMPRRGIALDDVPNDLTVFEPKALCFCDIPISSLPLHMEKYGDIGIGIRRSQVHHYFFDEIKPVHYIPYISDAILERENKLLWEKKDNGVYLKEYVKIPTLLNPDATAAVDSSEPFESIYEEREWRAMKDICIPADQVAYILLPERAYITESVPKLRKLISSGVGLIMAKDMYRLKNEKPFGVSKE